MESPMSVILPRLAPVPKLGLGLLFLALSPGGVIAEEPGVPARHTPSDPMEIRAQLVPLRYATLGAEMDGRISLLAVREGDSFGKGEVLVRFECSTQKAQLDRSEVEVAMARKSHAAKEKLFRLNAVGELDWDLALSAVERAEAERAATRTLLQKCQVVAPYAGRVAEQRVQAQQFVRAGEPLLDILDDRNLELQFIVPSRWLVWLAVGTGVRIAIDETGRTYDARVSRVAPRIDPVSQTVKIVAVISGHHPELLAGMSGELTVPEQDSGP